MPKKIVKYSVLNILLLLVLTLVTGCEASISYDSRPDIRESETSNLEEIEASNLEEIEADKVYALVTKGRSGKNLNVTIYVTEFTPESNPNYTCVSIRGPNREFGLQCFPKQ